MFAEKAAANSCSDMIFVEMHSIREADASAGDWDAGRYSCGAFVSVCRERDEGRGKRERKERNRRREWRSWREQLTVLLDWEAGEVVHGNIHGCGNNAFEEAVIAAPFFAPQTCRLMRRWRGRMDEHMHRRLHLPSS